MLNTLKYPIIQAPMAGGIATVELAKSVSQAGGLGFLAAGYKTIQALENEIRQLQHEEVQFGVNIFVPGQGDYDTEQLDAYKNKLEDDFNVTLGDAIYTDDEWDAKLDVVKKYKVPFVSFTFGCPSKEIITSLQHEGIYVMVTATNLSEAQIAYSNGANALCIQGIEAGGHRGSFENSDDITTKTLMELLLEIKSNIQLPLIAAGGIMNGRQVKQYLEAGASAVQLGTAFICCKESGANELYKDVLIHHKFSATRLTRAFTGRLARGLENDFITKYSDLAPSAYPELHYMTQTIRKQALVDKDPQNMSLWAGVGFKEVRSLPVAELMKQIMQEAEQLE